MNYDPYIRRWDWGRESSIMFDAVPVKLYRPAKPQRRWVNDGNTYHAVTDKFAKHHSMKPGTYGHPIGSNSQEVAVTHDVNLGPVVVDMQTGDRWPL